MTPFLTVVSPVFNEEQVIQPFLAELQRELEALGVSYEVVLVDDGSTDQSVEKIKEFNWPNVQLVSLPINLGHQAALDAGYRASTGDWVITMDSDLQHPPKEISAFLASAKSQDLQVVYGVRGNRKEEPLFKRFTAKLYYRLMRRMTAIAVEDSAADFRLLKREVVEAINALPPGPKVFRLLVPSLGFRSATVDFQAAERAAGVSKYNLGKMLGLLVTSTVSFSTRPLWLSIQLSMIFGVLAASSLVYILAMFFSGQTVPGWASTSSALLGLFSINFFILGVFGLYLGELISSQKANAVSASVIDKMGRN